MSVSMIVEAESLTMMHTARLQHQHQLSCHLAIGVLMTAQVVAVAMIATGFLVMPKQTPFVCLFQLVRHCICDLPAILVLVEHLAKACLAC